MGEIMLNLSAWIERRADDLKPYADHIIHSVKAYEAEIERLREDLRQQDIALIEWEQKWIETVGFTGTSPIRKLEIASQYVQPIIETDFGDYFIEANPSAGHVPKLFGREVPQKAFNVRLEGVGKVAGIDSTDEFLATAQADYDRRIRAALEPDTATEWQDISTAPSKTPILAVRANGQQSVIIWDDYKNYNQPKFTHWMHLRPAPEKEG